MKIQSAAVCALVAIAMITGQSEARLRAGRRLPAKLWVNDENVGRGMWGDFPPSTLADEEYGEFPNRRLGICDRCRPGWPCSAFCDELEEDEDVGGWDGCVFEECFKRDELEEDEDVGKTYKFGGKKWKFNFWGDEHEDVYDEEAGRRWVVTHPPY